MACGGHEAVGGGDDSVDHSVDKLDSQQSAWSGESAGDEKTGAQTWRDIAAGSMCGLQTQGPECDP